MNATQLKEIEDRVKATSPGDWTACKEGACSCKGIDNEKHPIAKVVRGDWGDEYPSIRLIGPSVDRKAEAYLEKTVYGNIPEAEAYANARFIAHAHQDIPDLIAEVKRLQDQVNRLVDFTYHKMHCQYLVTSNLPNLSPGPCDCGLEQALGIDPKKVQNG